MTTALVLAAAMAQLAPSFDTKHGRQELHAIAVQLCAYAPARGLEPELLAAVAMRESTFRRHARSTFVNKRTGFYGHSVGILGVKELANETRDLTDIATNVSAGSKLLAEAIRACRGDVEAALTAYSQGRGKRSKNCKPSKYSTDVLAYYQRLIAATAAGEKRR